jgi:23S rRNA pseudouridine1911/1915/1917 synthase
MTDENNTKTLEITEELDQLRLDQAASKLMPEYSRVQIQNWIKENKILLNNNNSKSKERVKTQDQIQVNINPDEIRKLLEDLPEDIPLDIVFEDEHILVINKPAGLVVHPGAGNTSGTLLNALLHYIPEQKKLARAGIVHRLDKDTSGIMVIAKSELAHTSLIDQLKNRSMHREYEAIVEGVLTGGFNVNEPIDRHPKNRVKMAVRSNGKEAITQIRVIKRFKAHTHVQARILTGRTHQIRVHCAHKGHPVLGDLIYGARKVVPKDSPKEVIELIRNFPRQALHAKTLTLIHPKTQEPMRFETDLAEDIELLLNNI